MKLTDETEVETRKYLTYFVPSREVTNAIMNMEGIKIPGNGLHCTICVFTMDPRKEDTLVSQLSDIKFLSFETVTQDTDEFDNDSIVLKFSKPDELDELQRLHKSVIAVVRELAEPEFQEIEDKYYGDKYNPHLTFSDEADVLKNEVFFLGIPSKILAFYLSSKVDGQWKVVDIFNAQDASV